ncbi:MAG: phosphate regulon sensor histidine kinase PhoR [Alphaproteobacteria bacterium]|nr:phosphate regulon sensor histidine kinase PhoR [Alphaproteobacteria bacterium]
MAERQPSRTLSAAVSIAAPGIIVLAILVLGGWLTPAPALAAAVALAALGGLIAKRHYDGLDRLHRRIEHLTEQGEDLKLHAPTVPRLSVAVGRLARRWQEQHHRLTTERATADRLLEALPDPLLVIDRAGSVVRANRAAAELTETNPIGRDLTAGLRHPVLLQAIERALSAEESQAVEISMPAPQHRSYSALIEPLGGAEGGALILLHDLTPIRLGEQMRADFVANVSHELRTPLASLLGFIETLRGAARDDPEAQERFLAIMHNQAERMARLIEDLLSLSRIELDERSRPTDTVALHPLLAKVRDALALKAEERGMTIEITGPHVTVSGEEDQLTQVFQNLIDNAIKYGHENTTVSVTVQAPPGRGVTVSVHDQGGGIPADHIPRLTERFYRVSAARSRELGGTGLGLAIVKHIVNRHRGQLSIDSAEGEGSTFSVSLPYITPPPGA